MQIGFCAALVAGVLVAATAPVGADVGGSAAAARWQGAIASVPLPGAGCFSASYPSLEWHATACVDAPRVAFAPGPHTVGDGHDYTAVTASPITKAVGSFVGVSPKVTEKGQYNGSGAQVANTYSLQLNSQFFTTPRCAGSSTPAKCRGWQQFVYDTHANLVFMQYWLIDYSASCPSGWFTFGHDCYTNSNAIVFSGPKLKAADLATVRLTGTAARNGRDTIQFANKGHASSVSNADSVVSLAQRWNTTEFDVVGDGGGGSANFGAKTTFSAQTALTSASHVAPKCARGGFTAETNNLVLAHTPAIGSAATPTMRSSQSNGPATTASCATAA
jgi:hypothetical protein